MEVFRRYLDYRDTFCHRVKCCRAGELSSNTKVAYQLKIVICSNTVILVQIPSWDKTTKVVPSLYFTWATKDTIESAVGHMTVLQPIFVVIKKKNTNSPLKYLSHAFL